MSQQHCEVAAVKPEMESKATQMCPSASGDETCNSQQCHSSQGSHHTERCSQQSQTLSQGDIVSHPTAPTEMPGSQPREMSQPSGIEVTSSGDAATQTTHEAEDKENLSAVDEMKPQKRLSDQSTEQLRGEDATAMKKSREEVSHEPGTGMPLQEQPIA